MFEASLDYTFRVSKMVHQVKVLAIPDFHTNVMAHMHLYEHILHIYTQ